MTKLILELPIPLKALRPNGNDHNYWGKTKAKKMAKAYGLSVVREKVATSPFDPQAPLNILYTYYPPAPRGRYLDDDNLIASMKSYRDGIAAGLQMDDKGFITHPPQHGPKEGNGKVIVELWQL